MPLPKLSEIAQNIELRADGVWAARTASDVSYSEDGNELCFAVEDQSFWFLHRNNCILEVVKSFPAREFFDIGGGNGCVARALQDAGVEVVLVEPGPSGSRNAILRGVRNVVQGTMEDAGFLPETLPSVGLFDVLEHIRDDGAFMTEIHRLLMPGGRIYVTVPAYQWLWAGEDRDAGHWRRYTLRSLSSVLRSSGFTIEFATYFFGFLPVPIFLFRTLPYRLGLSSKKKRMSYEATQSDHQSGNSVVNQVLQFLTRTELSRMAAKIPCRFGGSCLAVARKC